MLGARWEQAGGTLAASWEDVASKLGARWEQIGGDPRQKRGSFSSPHNTTNGQIISIF